MSYEDNLNSANRGLEDALRSLSPTRAHVDPIAAAFHAGEKSARRTTHRWQSVAAIVTLLLIGSWMIPSPSRTAAPPLVQMTTAPVAMEPLSSQSILVMQHAVTTGGIDALPRSAVPTSSHLSAKDLF